MLERKLSVFDRGERPDYEVVLAVIDYFKGYPDCHHPKEDMIVEKLKARDHVAAATIGDLEAGHQEGAKRLRRVAQAVERVLSDQDLLRQNVDNIIRGLSLLVGLVRVSAAFGVALLVMYWTAHMDWPFIEDTNNFIIDYHIVYATLCVYLIVYRAGHVWGLDAWAEKLSFVEQRPSLRFLVACGRLISTNVRVRRSCVPPHRVDDRPLCGPAH